MSSVVPVAKMSSDSKVRSFSTPVFSRVQFFSQLLYANVVVDVGYAALMFVQKAPRPIGESYRFAGNSLSVQHYIWLYNFYILKKFNLSPFFFSFKFILPTDLQAAKHPCSTGSGRGMESRRSIHRDRKPIHYDAIFPEMA